MSIVPDAPDRGYSPLAAIMGKIGGYSAMNLEVAEDLDGNTKIPQEIFNSESVFEPEVARRARETEIPNLGGLGEQEFS